MTPATAVNAGDQVRRSVLRLHVGCVGTTEADELATSHALLRRVACGEIAETLRVYAPKAPTVVFGRRDTRCDGFRDAVAAARAAGFATAVRAVGGRAVAYTENALVVDQASPERGAGMGLERRFQAFGELIAFALRQLGVDAHVGEVAGEPCPGAYSVNARHRVKLVGTAQRVLRNAWLFSSLLTVSDHDQLRAVLTDVYHHLRLPFDPESVGSIADEIPGVGVAAVQAAVLRAWHADPSSVQPVGEAIRALGRELRQWHGP